jgi:hypothetical protein
VRICTNKLEFGGWRAVGSRNSDRAERCLVTDCSAVSKPSASSDLGGAAGEGLKRSSQTLGCDCENISWLDGEGSHISIDYYRKALAMWTGDIHHAVVHLRAVGEGERNRG